MLSPPWGRAQQHTEDKTVLKLLARGQGRQVASSQNGWPWQALGIFWGGRDCPQPHPFVTHTHRHGAAHGVGSSDLQGAAGRRLGRGERLGHGNLSPRGPGQGERDSAGGAAALPRAPLTSALLQTYTIDRQVPDSAGTGTAYLCGVKTNAKTLGLSGAAAYGKCRTAFGNEVDSVLHRARLAGMGGQGNSIAEPSTARTGSPLNLVLHCR